MKFPLFLKLIKVEEKSVNFSIQVSRNFTKRFEAENKISEF